MKENKGALKSTSPIILHKEKALHLSYLALLPNNFVICSQHSTAEKTLNQTENQFTLYSGHSTP